MKHQPTSILDECVKILYNLGGVSIEKTWQIELPEWLVWRLYGDSVESDNFYEDVMVKLV